MKKGFTLTELLVALTMVGIIAILTIPILMSNIHNRMFATQIKNMSATIEQLAQDQLIEHRTRDLFDTDFADPDKLLSDRHFSIVKTCSSSDAPTECWKTTATGKDKVTYKNLKNETYTGMYYAKTIILKNGVMLTYFPDTAQDQSLMCFFIDINGNDKPNIAGRDLFAFYIDSKGHVISLPTILEYDLSTTISKCKTMKDISAWHCYGVLSANGWKMDY